MRHTLIAAAIMAFAASGCVSNATRDTSPGSNGISSIDSSRPKSCYGGPVYVPC